MSKSSYKPFVKKTLKQAIVMDVEEIWKIGNYSMEKEVRFVKKECRMATRKES